MDREIPKEVRQNERNKKLIRYGIRAVAGLVVISVLISLMRTGVKEKDLVFSTVSQGVIEVSVSASGKVVPAFEEIINSPINTRIMEVYKKGGDSVDVGTPILKLDLQSIETEYKKLLDEEQMRSYKLQQLKVNNQTKLNDLQMQIKVLAMKLNRMKVELRNERYLDSLGSGTTDKVRQAELSYNVAQLEYEQLKQQYVNEQKVLAAEYKVQELEFSIFRKGLAEMKRTFDDAQVRSPRKAILTYVNNQIGAQVVKGSQVAIISDLSHFKVEGEIADTYGDRVTAGGKAIVKVGSEKLEGTVSSVSPLSKNGVISFTVQLQDDSHRRLRSGLKTDVYVMNAVKEDVMRLANASYYMGRGEYELFVRISDNELVKRKVQLGDSNFEFVEVVSGLQPGDRVVVSDMSSYRNKTKLKMNNNF
ncbi:efflux transporter, RND family, MFP subunit [gut metagenome]|uniref:Efflux transporter, RND family, MFP subunit n=1 Tax=gut metagenome TaxID=749906 RepID=J9CYJ5_9ZZZZ